MSASLLLWASLLVTVGEQLGQDGGAEGKETWEMSYLAPRSYGTGLVALTSSGAPGQREAAEHPFPCGALSTGQSLLLPGSSGGSCLCGEGPAGLCKTCCCRQRGVTGRLLPLQTRGDTPGTAVLADGAEERLTDELRHLFILLGLSLSKILWTRDTLGDTS